MVMAREADDLDRTSAPRDDAAVEPIADPRNGARRDRQRRSRLLRRAIGPLLLLCVWQLLYTVGVLSHETIATPIDVVRAGWELLQSGQLQSNLLVSVRRVGLGMLFGMLAGVTLALIAGLFRVGNDLLGSTMELLRAVPVLGLMPLVILWFGVDERPKVILLAVGATFPIYLSTHAAIRGIDVRLIETAQTFGLNRWSLARRVILPGALPGFLLGVRYALTGSWLYLVFVEQLNARSGIGYLMNNAQTWGRTDVLVLCLVVYAGLGLLTHGLVGFAERRLLGWRRGFVGT